MDGRLDDDPTEWESPLGDLLGTPAGSDSPSHTEIIGTPIEDAGVWDGRQSYSDTCAVRCQEFILEQFTGQEFDEAALVAESAANGWYVPGEGTNPAEVGNLLEAHGVEVNRYEFATTYDLASELAQGHKVIVGVDAGELWDPMRDAIESSYGLDSADHAVVVSGIDTTDPDNLRVIISDPGTGNPVATYPMDQFLSAWQDSGFYMVATADPAPSHLPEMVNFAYEEGHVPEVLGMSFDELTAYAGNTDAFEALVTGYGSLADGLPDLAGESVDAHDQSTMDDHDAVDTADDLDGDGLPDDLDADGVPDYP